MKKLLNAALVAESSAAIVKALAALRVSNPLLEEAKELYSAAIRSCIIRHRPIPRPPKVPASIVALVLVEELEEEDPPITEAEVGGCKALLLEIIRRASYDWVLYRMSKVGQKRRLAEDAFNWLFKEGPGQTEWLERITSKKEVTSFIAICEALELSPETVRNHIRRLTVKNVMSIGRPAEYRRQEWRGGEDSYSAGVGDRALSEISGGDDFSDFEGLGGNDF